MTELKVLQSYRSLHPGMGQAVAERTILRKKEDGTWEDWGDVADRVALGNSLLCPETKDQNPEYKLLRKHIAKASLLMSGRHLQHGDGHQPKRNMEVFTNCFDGPTKIITLEYGAVKLEDVSGENVTVISGDGTPRNAVVHNHGTQAINEIVFYANKANNRGVSKTVRVTPNHRWPLNNDSITTDIKVGDILKPAPSIIHKDDLNAKVHGLIFGDGSAHKSRNDKYRAGVSQGRTYAAIRVCDSGSIRETIHELLDDAGYKFSTPPHANGDRVYYIGKQEYIKDVPFTTDPEYISSFIEGWWIADGSKTLKGDVKEISTTNITAITWLEQYSALAGYSITMHRIQERKEGDGSYRNGKPLHTIRLRKNIEWKVSSITPAGETVVYCPEEPVTSQFVLANGLLTGNCATAASSFVLFYLLLNGSGVGRCYDDDMMLVNWDNAPSVRCVLDEDHPDFDWSAHESSRDAIHKYGDGKDTLWFAVSDDREGWAKALELWENAAFEKIHRDKTLVLDFSNVREKGQPIGGMQSRPASGPVPLMNAFQKAASLKGAGLSPWRQAIYVDHYFAECVLVGGARRAARMSTKYWKDEHIFGFITVKRPIEFADKKFDEIMEIREEAAEHGILPPQGFLWSSNNSVAVDSEFWELATLKRGHPKFMTALAQHARKVLKMVTEASYADGTGEPGLINVDKLVQKDDGWDDLNRGDFIESKKYQIEDDTQILISRLAKKAKRKKYNMITNPSMRAGTLVLTKNGIYPIEKLEGTEFEVKTINGNWAKAQCWLSGKNKKLNRIILAGGHEHYATDEHKWPILDKENKVHRTATTKLKSGDYLPVNQSDILFSSEIGTRSEGFLVGWNLGDGWISKRTCDAKMQIGFIVSENDEKNNVKSILINELKNKGYTGSFEGKTEINISCLKLREFFEKVGVVHKSLGLPSFVFEDASEDFRKGLLDALFSADGSIGRKSDLILTSAHRQLVDDVASLLSLYGIPSMIYSSYTTLGDKQFKRYDLKITKRRALEHFSNIIGLSHTEKNNKLNEAVNRKTSNNERHIDKIKILAVEETDLYENVWDINVDDETHSFQIPHCITGNCGEIALNVLGGYCVIADVVPYHADSLDEAEEAFRVATRALIRVNLMDSLYKTEVKRTNRIGVGMTGVHEFAWKFFKLGFHDLIDEEKSQDFWQTLNRFNRAVYEEARDYSAQLGLKTPHTMTTIKPAGTTSKLFGLTEGWHLPALAWYMRWVQFRNDDPLVDTYRKAGYPVRELVKYQGTMIVGFPTEPAIAGLGLGDKFITAGEATPEEQYKWLMLGEKYWINGVNKDGTERKANYGNQISYTLKYKPEEVDFKQFRDMLIQYQSQIRACSVMPQIDASAFEYQPEENLTKAEYEAVARSVGRVISEDIGKEHIDCGETGACPVDFTAGDKAAL